MPYYYDRNGQRVSEAEALNGSNAIKDGYRMALAPGERVNFDISLIDHAPSHAPVFLNDANAKEASAKADIEVAKMRAHHDRKFAFMGDQAPSFNEQVASQRARSKVADAARASSGEIRRPHSLT